MFFLFRQILERYKLVPPRRLKETPQGRFSKKGWGSPPRTCERRRWYMTTSPICYSHKVRIINIIRYSNFYLSLFYQIRKRSRYCNTIHATATPVRML